MPAEAPRRWARLRHQEHHQYPIAYHHVWFRVLERHDPDVPLIRQYIWLDLAGNEERVLAEHFEIAERSKRRILVVDDDAGIRKALQIALSTSGHEVIQARDGEEGLRLWQESGPDLLITDIHMPKKSGLLLIEELRLHSTSTRIIAMTDGGPATRFDLLGLATHLGAVQTIAKPFPLDRMLSLVEQQLA